MTWRGTLPCKRFFADAAWFRLNVLAYNVLAVMKRAKFALLLVDHPAQGIAVSSAATWRVGSLFMGVESI